MDLGNPLQYLKSQAVAFGVYHVCQRVLDDPRLPLWSGSHVAGLHHYGKGGLVQHVAEVAKLCRINNEALGEPADPVALFLAAVFHDVGKMWDFEPRKLWDGETWTLDYSIWDTTPHKSLMHHVSRSAFEWRLVAQQETGLPSNYLDEVTHAILSHHGLREWGSPVGPQTKMAWLLHLCDSISARLNDGGHRC